MDYRIYVVFKTHFDIGFTELSEEVIARYSKKMLSDVIKTCEETKDLGDGRKYVWTMSSWPLVKTIEQGRADEKSREKAIELIKKGQIAWHALPYTTHTEFCSLEELIRGINISTNLSHEYAYWPISAKMTDVPGHTWILPTLLANAGIKFLHLGCNPGCMSPDVPRLFWWEGIDGSRVLTFYSKGAYGSDCIPPDDWQYPAWLAMMQTNDNIGPQDSKIIEQIENTVYAKYPNAKIKITTMDDFYNDIISCNPDIPVIKKDLADSWIHGVGTYPKEVSKLRNNRVKLQNAEKILAYQLINNKNENYDKDLINIDSAYENSLLFGEHTWGLDVKTHMGAFRHYNKKDFLNNKNSDIYKFMEKSWDEQRHRVNTACNITENLICEYGKHLVDNININNDKIVIFNPSGVSGDSWVTINKLKNATNFKDIRNNEIVKTRFINNEQQVYIKSLPSFGYITIIPTNEIQTKETDLITQENDSYIIIQNSFYRLTVDKKIGAVISLIDLSSNKEWVDTSSREGFGGYRYDSYGIEDVTSFIRDYSFRFYDWLINDLGRINYPQCSHNTLLPNFNNVKVFNDMDSINIIISSKGCDFGTKELGDCEEIITTITLLAFDKEIKIKYELINKQETSMIEAGHFVFPLKLSNARYRINKVGSVVDPAVNISKDANNILYCLEDWVDVNDGNNGLTIVSHDIPLLSIGNEGIYKYRKEFKEDKPWLYFNAFNNAWGTNFPQWMGGNYTFSFSLFTHNEDSQEGNVANSAQRLINPPISFYGNSVGGKCNPTSELIKINGDLIISAFTKAHYNDNSFILRLRNINSNCNEVNVKIPTATKVMLCDLQERPLTNVDLVNNEFIVNSKPYGVYNYIVRF